MKVVRHQAGSEHVDWVALCSPSHQVREEVEILRGMKDRSTVVAPIQDVIVDPGVDVARCPWHFGDSTEFSPQAHR